MAATDHPGNRPALTVVQLSDTHLLASPTGALRGYATERLLRAVLGELSRASPGPDLLILTGDLVHDGSEAGYQRLAHQVAGVGAPTTAWVPGNHDDPERMADVLAREGLPWTRSLRLGDWEHLFLSTHLPGADYGELAPGELEALAESLQGPGPPHLLVWLHHPPVPVGSRWLDALGLTNASALGDLLAGRGRVRGIVCGHIHQAFAGELAGIPVWGSPSTCMQFQPFTEELTFDTRPPGYRRWVLTPDGRIDTEVVWVGGERCA
jgi:Icc protein